MSRSRVLLQVVIILALPRMAGAQAFSKNDPVGAEQEFVTTNAEGWVSEKTVFKITEKETSAGKTILTLSQKTSMRPARDSAFTEAVTSAKLYYTVNSIVTPKDNLASATSVLDDLFKDQDMKMDLSVSGDDPSIPLNPKAGEKLPDIQVDIVISIEGLKARMVVKETDRRVGVMERVSVPAGSFDAYVLESNSSMKATILLISQTEKMKQKSWLVPGMGEIKEMTYDKKGKIESVTELVRYNK